MDYAPSTADEFMNLALMDPTSNLFIGKKILDKSNNQGQLYLFYFTSNSQTDNNQTLLISHITTTTQSYTLGFKGTLFSYSLLKSKLLGFDSVASSQDPAFGPYNNLMCRSGQIASFPLNASISTKGIVVAMDFFPYPNGPTTQTIFSIRNTATNVVSLRCDYFSDTKRLNIWINPIFSASSTPYYVFNAANSAATAVTSGNLKSLNQLTY